MANDKDPSILFVKPKAISVKDKRVLKDMGIAVIEIENVSDAKFVRAATEIHSSQMLRFACQAIKDTTSDEPRRIFGKAIAAFFAQQMKGDKS